ncbi:hypothetical protein [Streptomyces sp. NRRL B-24720]|nr:hypothetical protein [Streptomyces sp. NRRL B-24720]
MCPRPRQLRAVGEDLSSTGPPLLCPLTTPRPGSPTGVIVIAG